MRMRKITTARCLAAALAACFIMTGCSTSGDAPFGSPLEPATSGKTVRIYTDEEIE